TRERSHVAGYYYHYCLESSPFLPSSFPFAISRTRDARARERIRGAVRACNNAPMNLRRAGAGRERCEKK
ncbi:hypothetical protein X777_07621, partial [Ooceraea biroi]